MESWEAIQIAGRYLPNKRLIWNETLSNLFYLMHKLSCNEFNNSSEVSGKRLKTKGILRVCFAFVGIKPSAAFRQSNPYQKQDLTRLGIIIKSSSKRYLE